MLLSLFGCSTGETPAATDPTTVPTQPPAEDQTYPTVSGTFMQPWAFSGYDVERMTAHLQSLKAVGIDLLISASET